MIRINRQVTNFILILYSYLTFFLDIYLVHGAAPFNLKEIQKFETNF